MKLKIETDVRQDYRTVFAGFSRELFLALNPPFPPVELQKFGMAKGDEVHILLKFGLFSQQWVSLITETGESETEIYFVDEGVSLPFFLKKWRHRHRILRRENGARIIDDITFEGRFPLLTYLLFPVLYAQFRYRSPVYRRFFGKP